VGESRELLSRMSEHASGARLASAEKLVAEAKAQLLATHQAVAKAELGPTGDVEARAALEALRLDKQLAERSYQTALDDLDEARSASTKRTQLLALAEPSLPEQATHPRRAYGILTTFFVALALFGIVRLLISAVREHAQI
jgi:capsular polysaccharide transport system permease protein